MKKPDYSVYFFCICMWLLMQTVVQCKSMENIEEELHGIKLELHITNYKVMEK